MLNVLSNVMCLTSNCVKTKNSEVKNEKYALITLPEQDRFKNFGNVLITAVNIYNNAVKSLQTTSGHFFFFFTIFQIDFKINTYTCTRITMLTSIQPELLKNILTNIKLVVWNVLPKVKILRSSVCVGNEKFDLEKTWSHHECYEALRSQRRSFGISGKGST